MSWKWWGSVLGLVACRAQLEAGEVRMASLEGAITYELRSVVVLRGSTCQIVTAYLAIGGSEDPATDASCWTDGDVLDVSAERDGVTLTGSVDVGVQPWAPLELVVER